MHRVVWFATKSTMNFVVSWWILPLSKISANWTLVRSYLTNTRNDPNSLSQTTNPNRLCAFLWCALGLGVLLCWSFGSPPHCLRIVSVGVECELLGMLGGTWSIDSETQVSECERNDSFAFVTLKSFLIHTSWRWFWISSIFTNEAPWNEPSLQSSIWFPTWQNCLWFFVLIDVMYQFLTTFGHKAHPILLLIVPECLLTMLHLVLRFLPNTCISEKSEHMLQRALPLFHSLSMESSDRIRIVLPRVGEKCHHFVTSQYLSTHFSAWPSVS